MPLRGENVGSAYVRIYADGSEVPGDIRDALNDAEPSVRAAGRDHGEAYGEEFSGASNRSFKTHFNKTKGEMFGDLNENLRQSIRRIEIADTFFQGREWQRFLKRVDKNFGDAGVLAAKRLEAQFRDSADFERMVSNVKNIGPLIRKAQLDILTSLHEDALAENRRFDREEQRLRVERDKQFELEMQRRSAAWAEMLDDAYQENRLFDARWRQMIDDQEREYDQHLRYMASLHEAYAEHEARTLNERDAEFEQSVKDRQRYVNRINEQFDKMTDAVTRFAHGEQAHRGSRRRLIRDFQDLERIMRAAGGASDEWVAELRRQERALRVMSPEVNRFNRNLSRLADTMGRLYGRGSRNDFLNFVGSFVRGSVNMLRVLPTVVGWFLQLGRSMHFAFDDAARSGASTFRAFVAAVVVGAELLGSAILAATLAISGFGIALGILMFVAGPVVAFLSGLLAIVTALTASITFGAIAAVAALAGAFTILTAGIGIGVAAYKSLTDAQKEALKADFQPVIDSVKRLGQAAAEGAFKDMADQGARLADVLDRFEPLFTRVGRRIRYLANDWLAAVESDGFKRFRRELTDFLPRAIESLGTSIGNVIGGLGGIFIASIPMQERFLTWLEDITDEFNDWANSTKGQTQLKDFFEEAGDSAKEIGGFLSELTGLISDLFAAGKGEGDSIFDRMEGGLENIREFFEENPQALEDWFEHAGDTLGALADLIEDVNRLLDDLDSKQNRLLANDALRLLGDIINGIAVSSEIAANNVHFLLEFLEAIAWAAEETWKMLENVAGAIEDFFIIEDLPDIKLPNIDWPDFGKGFGGAVKMIDPTILVPKVTQFANIAGRLPGMIRERLSGTENIFRGAINGIPGIAAGIFNRLPGPAQRAVVGMTNAFNGLGGKIIAKFSGLPSDVKIKFDAAVEKIRGIPGEIVGLFTGLAGRIIAAVGDIVLRPRIEWPSLKPPGGYKSGGTSGGAATRMVAAPLTTDPAVRAFTVLPGGADESSTVGPVGPQIDASGWTVVTPSDDPWVVAKEVLNELAAKIA